MKILVVSNLYPPDFIGGYELGCRQAVDALRDRGHEVRVLTSTPRTPVPAVPHVRRRLKFNNDYWTSYYHQTSAPVSVRLSMAESLLVNARNIFSLIEELEEFQPDVVYLWMLTGLGVLGLLGCLHHLQIPWVWHLMDDVTLGAGKTNGLVHPVLAGEFQRQVRGSYLACSRRVVDEIEADGFRFGGDVEILPNWIADRPIAARTEYLESGILRIASSGQLGRHKGIDLIIQAVGLLKDEGLHNVRLDLFGRTEDSTFQMMVQDLDLGDRVSFRGVRSQAELMRLYRDYDVFAFPTWEREPCAFAPLEAAASGCVPVMSQICGNSEWLVNGVHCVKVPRTAEALAGAFREILQGRIDLAPIGRRVGAMVRRDFHLNTLILRIERALDRAARAPRTPGGSVEDAYRLGLLAEKLTHVLVQESFRAA